MAIAPVQFENVWKKFRRGERHDSLRDLVPATIASVLRRRDRTQLMAEEFWALRDVSFEVPAGSALGIIGPNGAGKSTTLKLLTSILRPTKGRAELNGRVGALIEVAAGFHPDLTGRENIFLQGAIMGMKRAEIERHLDEIVSFAGVEGFIDTPVKRYSSGMNARLGFSIAAHLEPDVLIIDEVLSVGDIAFQQKCVERMQVFKQRGVTIVFVSHNLQAVANLCDTALMLQGETKAYGPVDDVLRHYVSATVAGEKADTGPIRLLDARLTDAEGHQRSEVRAGEHLTLSVTVERISDLEDMTFGFILFRSTDLLYVYESDFNENEIGMEKGKGTRSSLEYTFRAGLARGQYHIECYAIHRPTHEYVARLCPAAVFTVDERQTTRGVADLELKVSARQLAVAQAGGSR